MGITEEAGKAAGQVVDALRSTPIILALVIFNVLFMFLMTYASIKSSEHWDAEVERWARQLDNAIKQCSAREP